MQGLEKKYPILILKSPTIGNCCSAQGENLGKQRTEIVFANELLSLLSQKGPCTVCVLRNQLQKLLGWLAEEISPVEKVLCLQTVLFHIRLKARNFQSQKTGIQLVSKKQFIASSDI